MSHYCECKNCPGSDKRKCYVRDKTTIRQGPDGPYEPGCWKIKADPHPLEAQLTEIAKRKLHHGDDPEDVEAWLRNEYLTLMTDAAARIRHERAAPCFDKQDSVRPTYVGAQAELIETWSGQAAHGTVSCLLKCDQHERMACASCRYPGCSR